MQLIYALEYCIYTYIINIFNRAKTTMSVFIPHT